ncbi:Hsp20/alpha crystallin family protein [Afipia sp. TerB]
MAVRDIIPWSHRGRDVGSRPTEDVSPFLSLHREMNRLFDDVFRGFDAPFFSSDLAFNGRTTWPAIEVTETEKELQIAADLPGLDQKDIEVEYANGALVLRGEKKSESVHENRRFSERYYGRFERRIPVEDIDQDNIQASFKDGVLTVTLPRSPSAQQKIKRITVNN